LGAGLANIYFLPLKNLEDYLEMHIREYQQRCQGVPSAEGFMQTSTATLGK
jgi:hypothetical protein